MTIKQEYNRARKAYLSRIRYYRNRGYIIEEIPRPKKPTRASINRLKRMSGEAIKRNSVSLVNVLTGEMEKPTTKQQRLAIEKQNVQFFKLTPEEQSISRETGTITRIQVGMSTATMTPSQSYEALIDNWYSQISHYRPDIFRRIESRTNELIEGKPAEVRRKFAYVLWQNPDIFPQSEDSVEEVINMKMENVLHIMNIAEGSEAYYDFLEQFDGVERERE